MVGPVSINPMSQLRRGVLEYCVLSLLSRDGQLYGFDIVRRLSDVKALTTSEGTTYPMLSRLRGDGWVSTSWAESVSGPPRRYYAITASGRTALGAFTSDWDRFQDSVDDLLLGRI